MNRLVLLPLLLIPSLAAAQPAAKLSPEVRKYVSVSEPVVALTNVRIVDGTGAPPDRRWRCGRRG
jgi:hypothetical protein